MSVRRLTILFSLAMMTVLFLGAAAFTFFGNPFRREPLSMQTLPVGLAPQALRIRTEQTGIVGLSFRDLRASNLPFETPSADELSLSLRGEQVPFYVAGEGEESTLYFFAEAITRSVESPVVYWLAPGRGKTMSQRDRSPQAPATSIGTRRQYWEENTSFQPLATGSDNWLGQNLYAPGRLEVPLTGIQPSGGPGQITVRVWSGNQSPENPDHHMEVWLNDLQLADHYWDGIREETLVVDLSPGSLRPTNNRLILNVPGDTGAAGESIYLDWISLEYEANLELQRGQLLFRSSAPTIHIDGAGEETLVFDVSDPKAPVLLINGEPTENGIAVAGNGANRRYLALDPRRAFSPQVSLAPEWEEPLRSPGRGADYIAIVADKQGFSEVLQPLLEHRREQGLRVTAVPLQQIYDEFAFGHPEPEAIRNFLAYTQNSWEPPTPAFVLLVGDASYDQNDYLRGRNRNLLPTHLARTIHAGYVASDTWFTILEDQGSTPTMAVGRFPAQTLEQLETMVRKTLAYEDAERSEWLGRALLVADDEVRFNTASNWLAGELSNRGYQTQKLYMTESEDIRDAIISAVNHGVGLVNYVGHGSINVWGDEIVLDTDDVSMFMNGEWLPIFTTFTCLNGFFNHPDEDALAETLLWAEDGGVVAAVAPSGRTFTSQQTPLANTFYDALLTGDSGTLGEALLHAKIDAARDPNLGEVVHTFNLLGDPALKFRAPRSEAR